MQKSTSSRFGKKNNIHLVQIYSTSASEKNYLVKIHLVCEMQLFPSPKNRIMQGAGVLRKRNDIFTSLVLVETSSFWQKKLSIYDLKKVRGQEPEKKEPENPGFCYPIIWAS